MKKLCNLVIMAVCLVVCTMLTNCSPAKAEQGGTDDFSVKEQNQEVTQNQTQQPQTKQVSQQSAPQQTTTQTVKFYGPVSWNNEAEWKGLPITRDGVKELEKNTPSHKKLAYPVENAYVTGILQALEIRGIPSGASSTQYVVWYTYTTDNSNEATGLVLIQSPTGKPDEVKAIIRDMASTLNKQKCCNNPGCDAIYFGGSFVETKYNGKPVDPCKANANGNCGPCQQQSSGPVVGSGGDINASPNIPNSNRNVPHRG